jgi:putative IMPACT (imprinted ancient) family translation regulator
MAIPRIGYDGWMQRILAPCGFRFREKASVFLTELHPAPDAQARAAVLAALRKRDHDANHHCSAWRERPEAGGAQGADDDGEPAGTAGMPMLRVLEGQDLVDTMAVCIRWFGGTKLGTGGLVRAYTEGVQGALAEARAKGLRAEVTPRRQGALTVPAEQAHLPYAVLGAFAEAEILGQEFGPEGTTLRFRLPPGGAPALEAAWQDRSRGGRVRWDPAEPPGAPIADP